jgi:hypothetical protein
VYAATPARMFPGRRQRRARARGGSAAAAAAGWLQAGCRLAAGWLQAGCILFLAIFACGRFAIHQTGLLYSWIVLRVSR